MTGLRDLSEMACNILFKDVKSPTVSLIGRCCQPWYSIFGPVHCQGGTGLYIWCSELYAWSGAADSAGNLWRLRISGGCGASVEQSATTCQGRLVTAVILATDESSSLSSVVQLTQFCTVFVPAYHHVMFLMFFTLCKVTLQLLRSVTIILTFVVVVVVVVALA